MKVTRYWQGRYRFCRAWTFRFGNYLIEVRLAQKVYCQKKKNNISISPKII